MNANQYLVGIKIVHAYRSLELSQRSSSSNDPTTMLATNRTGIVAMNRDFINNHNRHTWHCSRQCGEAKFYKFCRPPMIATIAHQPTPMSRAPRMSNHCFIFNRSHWQWTLSFSSLEIPHFLFNFLRTKLFGRQLFDGPLRKIDSMWLCILNWQ